MEGCLAVKPIYIVVSQTGTVLSRILRIITRKEYNHASISFAEDLHIMYSFGRKNPYNPFWGGFVKESASFGTFKRFSNTKVIVLKLDINESTHKKMENSVNVMVNNPDNYKYNYLGLCLAAFKINLTKSNSYYCSEFIKDLLVRFNVEGADKLGKIVHPMHFLKIPDTQTVYKGKLSEYSLDEKIVV